ncbi:hypothetical protein HD553DRAFT_307001 [Filobasidium floriforme]|uniref:uncharacterized protein n=1 Tax=Filobasidium floriforme TaxID=5210 RepID=UPI001E8DA3E1|nr:uncharacterized protein HD553DRAFT_307001 [Filobasidium floriforme]KAH8087974.1 hypothetical protein HD553DRAFT_307001 [Filobasidium floriforme]
MEGKATIPSSSRAAFGVRETAKVKIRGVSQKHRCNLYYIYPKNDFDQDAAMIALKEAPGEAIGTYPKSIFYQGLEQQWPMDLDRVATPPTPLPPSNWTSALPNNKSSYVQAPSTMAELRSGLQTAIVRLVSGKGKGKAVDQDIQGGSATLVRTALKGALLQQRLTSDDRPVKRGTSLPLGIRPPTPSINTARNTEVTAASLGYEASRKEEEGLRESEAAKLQVQCPNGTCV